MIKGGLNKYKIRWTWTIKKSYNLKISPFSIPGPGGNLILKLVGKGFRRRLHGSLYL